MALIDVAAREIHGKIVYFGPGLGGKTTNLRYLHETLPPSARSELVSINSESERTLFFDFLPLNLGTVHGFTIRFQLYTVPGQTHYESARAAVLSGADGVVFVADARAGSQAENHQSLNELAQTLTRQGKSLEEFPVVLQYNKMDLPEALPVADLDDRLNPLGLPRLEAVALRGVGVFETLRTICKLVARNL